MECSELTKKFSYNESVKIISGFYAGQKGRVIADLSGWIYGFLFRWYVSKYKVRLVDGAYIEISGKDIEKIN